MTGGKWRSQDGSAQILLQDAKIGNANPPPTFAAVGRHLSEGIVTAVTLAPDHAGFALTLAAVPFARPGEGAHRVALTQQAGVAALGPVVVVLATRWGQRERHFHLPFLSVRIRFHLTAVTSRSCLFNNICCGKSPSDPPPSPPLADPPPSSPNEAPSVLERQELDSSSLEADQLQPPPPHPFSTPRQ